MIFFFFSSRRRHTRLQGDWSSDVCSSDLTVAGRQLGATDERDLFAWAVELCGTIQPRALLLENVRGLSTSRFSAYRQHVLDRLRDLGYVPGWRLLHASDFGVPQLRPRFVLVAVR